MKKITTYAFMIFIGAVLTIFLLGFKNQQTTTVSNSKNSVNRSSQSSSNSLMTLDQVSSHSTSSDCYLVIKNKVYDVSNYINQHPGGRRNITSRCGKEVTGIFASIHSNFAWNLLENYYIADIGDPNSQITPTSTQTADQQAILSDLRDNLLQIYPKAEVISVKPKKDFYLAVIINEDKLTEVHLDKNGKIINVEIEDEEHDWNNWEEDSDDD